MLGAGVFATGGPRQGPVYQGALAHHLAESGAVMYGAYRCPACGEQKARFGPAAELLPYAECDPKGVGARPALCASLGIRRYPTWIIAAERCEGVLSLDRLAELSRPRAIGVPGAGSPAVDFPDLKDTLQTLIGSLRYHLLRNLTVKAEYRFEHFNLSNFKTDGLEPFMANSNVNAAGTVSPSLDVFLGDRVDDYVAHVIALSLIYRF